MLKRTPLKKKQGLIKKKHRTPEQIQQAKEDGETMWALFELHWLIKTKRYGYHYCEACGERILGENKTLYHHHVLPKHLYKEYALMVEGLMLVHWDCHNSIEQCAMSNDVREKIEKIKERVKILYETRNRE